MHYRITKLVAINIFAFIGILVTLNLSVIIIFQCYKGISSMMRDNDNNTNCTRSNLPNYSEIDWAKIHFNELGKLESEYKSYIGWRRSGFSGQTININDEGIRHTPQSELVTEHSPLVVFLGGSTTWGTGSDDKNTIPALFSQISGGQYRTINLGESAYRAFQEYIFLSKKITESLKPDIVISYDGVNARNGFKSELHENSHSREHQIRYNLLDDSLTPRRFLIGPLETFTSKLHHKFGFNDTSNIYQITDERVERVAELLLNTWLLTKSLTESRGALYICSLQPNAAVGNPYLEHLNLDDNGLRVYRELYPMILKLLKTPQYKELMGCFIDLTNSFDIDEEIYLDFCHVSPNGNAIIADRLHKFVNELMQKR